MVRGVPPSSRLGPCAIGARGPSPDPSYPRPVCAPSSSSSYLGGFPSSCPGMPCAGSAHFRTGGSPLRPGSACAPWARAVRPPHPPARARFACAAGAGGLLPRPGPCRPGGSRGGVIRGFPPVPLMRAVGACYWVGGPPPPSPPWQPLALGAGSRSGGGLGSVRPPSGSRALRARWEPPFRSCSPPHGVVLRCCDRGFPLDPSLRAMGTHCWLGVPPPPSSPRRMLALGARDRLGGRGLSSVSL